jgi:hypothetical protein
MNDWNFRPLSKAMIKYAMDDVKYLLVCCTAKMFSRWIHCRRQREGMGTELNGAVGQSCDGFHLPATVFSLGCALFSPLVADV